MLMNLLNKLVHAQMSSSSQSTGELHVVLDRNAYMWFIIIEINIPYDADIVL